MSLTYPDNNGDKPPTYYNPQDEEIMAEMEPEQREEYRKVIEASDMYQLRKACAELCVVLNERFTAVGKAISDAYKKIFGGDHD